MKLLLIIATLLLAFSCAPTRVLVKDCKNATDGMSNCELIMKL
jgi:hypothetical protein